MELLDVIRVRFSLHTPDRKIQEIMDMILALQDGQTRISIFRSVDLPKDILCQITRTCKEQNPVCIRLIALCEDYGRADHTAWQRMGSFY